MPDGDFRENRRVSAITGLPYCPEFGLALPGWSETGQKKEGNFTLSRAVNRWYMPVLDSHMVHDYYKGVRHDEKPVYFVCGRMPLLCLLFQ